MAESFYFGSCADSSLDNDYVQLYLTMGYIFIVDVVGEASLLQPENVEEGKQNEKEVDEKGLRSFFKVRASELKIFTRNQKEAY